MESLGTVFLVDDDDDLRNSVASILRRAGLTVESYGSPEGLLSAPSPASPGCFLFDLQMPGMDGLELRKRLFEKGCRQPFIVLSGRGDISLAVEAMQLGAIDFIEKPFSHERLLDAVKRAIELDADASHERAEQQQVQQRLNMLTAREHDVLDRVSVGRLSKQIANELEISPKTVEVHRSRIMKKLEVDSLAQLLHMMTRRSAQVANERRAGL